MGMLVLSKSSELSLFNRGLSWRQSLLLLILYGIAYGGLYKLSATMHGLAEFSLWYPAAGFRFALIFIFGWRFGLLTAVPEIIAQGLLGEWSKLYTNPLYIIIGIGGPSIIYTGLLFGLDRLRYISSKLSSLSYIVWFCLAALIAPALAAPPMTANAILNGRIPLDAFYDATISFWIGDLVGILMVAPLVLLIIGSIADRSLLIFKQARTSRFIFELSIAISLAAVIFYFMGESSLSLRWVPLLAPLMAMAYRYGFVGSALMVFVLNIMAVIPAAQMDVIDRFELQTFLAVISFMGLMFGGVVTSRERDKARLFENMEAMAHMDRRSAVGDMATKVFHEIDQPISIMNLITQGAIDQLNKGTLDEAGLRRIMELSQQENTRTHSLIRRMKSFVKGGALEKADTTAQAVIESVKTLITLTAEGAGVTVAYELPSEPLPLCVDTILIGQAVINLCKNSIEAMEESEVKLLTISAGEDDEGRTYIAVTDTGPGLPNDYELGKSTKTDGMGLGLQIVNDIMDRHGGEVERGGSSMTLYI